MKYYKVRAEKSDWFNNYHTRVNELFTEKERNSKVRYINDFEFEIVNIPKNRIVKIDGRRFEVE